jgi:RNA polymerase sigma-70 factor (ECF subfamily)
VEYLLRLTVGKTSNEMFAKAFEEHRESLFRYLFTLSGNIAEAEDLAQECFLRLNQEFQRDKYIENVRAWLLRTGHNLAIDYYRHRVRSTADPLGDAAMQVPDKKQLSPDLMLERERTGIIRAAMSRLTLRQRTCLRLRAEGLRYQDIAGVLGISEGTVCEHIRRGLARLKKDFLAENL